MAINNQIIGGNFTDISGNPLANGFLLFELSQDEQSPTPGQVSAGKKIKVTLDNTGNVPSSPATYMWANDALAPTNSYYTVWAYTATGQLVWGPQQQQVLSSPSPFNLSAWVPNSTSSSTVGGSVQWGGIAGTLSNQTDLQTALDAKAPLASPALTGTPTAPTPAANDNSTKIATTAFVDAAVGGVSTLLSTPLVWHRVYATDTNALGTGREGLGLDGGPLATGINLTNQYSTGSYVAASSGDYAPGAIISTTGGNANSFAGISTGNASTTGIVGIRWANITLFTSRFYPKPAASPPVGSDNCYFIGVSKDIQRSGIFTGLPALTTGQINATWFANIAVAGFYFHPSESPNWQILASDGAGNSTKTITSVAASLTATQELSYTFNGVTLTFFIGGVSVGTINTNVPPANTPMCLNAMWGNLGSTATSQTESFGFGYMCLGLR